MFKNMWNKLINKDNKKNEKELNIEIEEKDNIGDGDLSVEDIDNTEETNETIEENRLEDINKEKVEKVDDLLTDINSDRDDGRKEELEESKNTIKDDVEDKVEETIDKVGLFQRLKSGLSKTKKSITDRVDTLISSYKSIDEDFFEELEEILIMADIGINTTMEIIDELEDNVRSKGIKDPQEIKTLLQNKLTDMLNELDSTDLNTGSTPSIILVVGVNGVGKTTSIGKIAHKLKNEGKKVLLAAGDTFRAAAIDQLDIWGDRVGVDLIKHQEGSDPAAVIYDAIQAAKARKVDVLICDTAGRLHNKKNLMNELGKIFNIVDREYPEANKEILLVLDATTGQNAIQQAKTFKEVTNITGLVLTKLDGTAKGGIVIAISRELNIPVKLIGVGEQMEDLQTFNSDAFVKALFGEE